MKLHNQNAVKNNIDLSTILENLRFLLIIMIVDNTNYFVLIISDEFCADYPHNLIPTPGYWIECSRQKISNEELWDNTDTDGDDQDEDEDAGEGPSRPRYLRDDCLLREDDEYFEEDEDEPPPPR